MVRRCIPRIRSATGNIENLLSENVSLRFFYQSNRENRRRIAQICRARPARLCLRGGCGGKENFFCGKNAIAPDVKDIKFDNVIFCDAIIIKMNIAVLVALTFNIISVSEP